MTESFRPGTSKGPEAIRRFSDSIETYDPILDRDLADLRIVDHGDVDFTGKTLDQALTAIEEAVRALPSGSFPLLFGGEHTMSLPAVRAIRERYPDLYLIQIDAHMDFPEQYEGQSIAHATVARRISDEMDWKHMIQVGVRSGTKPEWVDTRNLLHSTPELVLPDDVRTIIGSSPVYITLDIDVLDPSAAPGTGCLEPGGPTYFELHTFLKGLRGLNVVAADIVEVLPEIDPAGLAATSAAKLARQLMLEFVTPD